MRAAPLNEREKLQALVFQGYLGRRLSCSEARRRLSLPSSTFFRRLQRFKKYGKAGLVHRLRGKRRSAPILTRIQPLNRNLLPDPEVPFHRLSHRQRDLSHLAWYFFQRNPRRKRVLRFTHWPPKQRRHVIHWVLFNGRFPPELRVFY
jgi:hypothetical protein